MMFNILLLAFIKICFSSEVTKLQDLKGDAIFKPLKDSRTGACASDTNPYACDFSAPCPFGGSSESPWYQFDDYTDYQTWKDSVATSTTSTPTSVAVQLGGEIPYGILLSDPITCTSSDSTLYFKFWSTKKVMLKVCLISKATENELFCTDQLDQQSSSYPGSFTLNIPNAINEAFMIQFMASTEPGIEGFLILDDVFYYWQLCDSPTSCNENPVVTQNPPVTTTMHLSSSSTPKLIVTPSPPISTKLPSSPSISTKRPSSPSIATPIVTKLVVTSTPISTKKPTGLPNICQTVPCNFQNNWCQLSNAAIDATVLFQRRNTPYGPPVYRLFDIKMMPTTGYYISAMVNGQNGDVAILSSSQFEPSSNKQLTFKYYRAVDGHTIKVCFDTNFFKFNNKASMKQCGNAIPKLTGANALVWNTATVVIPNSATKFYMVAIHDGTSGGNGPIAIDDIVVVGC